METETIKIKGDRHQVADKMHEAAKTNQFFRLYACFDFLSEQTLILFLCLNAEKTSGKVIGIEGDLGFFTPNRELWFAYPVMGEHFGDGIVILGECSYERSGHKGS